MQIQGDGTHGVISDANSTAQHLQIVVISDANSTAQQMQIQGDDDDPHSMPLKKCISCILGPNEKERWSCACAKQLIERVIYAEGAENGLEFTVRPFNWIGPRMDFIPGYDEPNEGIQIQFLGLIRVIA